MKKAERDRAMMDMSQEVRNQFRRITGELREEMKAYPGHRVPLRKMLGSRMDKYPPEFRAPLESLMARDAMGPEPGEEPPDFFLKRLGSEERVRLSSLRGKRPVALAFGSYT